MPALATALTARQRLSVRSKLIRLLKLARQANGGIRQQTHVTPLLPDLTPRRPVALPASGGIMRRMPAYQAPPVILRILPVHQVNGGTAPQTAVNQPPQALTLRLLPALPASGGIMLKTLALAR